MFRVFSDQIVRRCVSLEEGHDILIHCQLGPTGATIVETGQLKRFLMQDSTSPLYSKMHKHLCNTMIGARELATS